MSNPITARVSVTARTFVTEKKNNESKEMQYYQVYPRREASSPSINIFFLLRIVSSILFQYRSCSVVSPSISAI